MLSMFGARNVLTSAMQLGMGSWLAYGLSVNIASPLGFFRLSLFLTLWSHALQTVFFLSAPVLRALIGDRPVLDRGAEKKDAGKLQNIYDGFFTLTALSSFTVTIHFWTLFFLHRDLVISEAALQSYPWWLNLLQHLWNSGFTLVEAFLVKHRFDTRRDLSLSAGLMLAYLGWITYGWFATGKWPYPFFEILDPAITILLITGVVASEGLIYKFAKITCHRE